MPQANIGVVYAKYRCKHQNASKTIMGILKQIFGTLSRIHILRLRDIANVYVSALESIHQLLDKQNADACNGHIHVAPPLLLFDSMLSAFHLSNKMKENLGSGISGMNCFL